MAKRKMTVPPNATGMYRELLDMLAGLDGWIDYIDSEMINAQNEGDNEKKEKLGKTQAVWQELSNLLYEVTGFIESKWMG
jgi:hypothetical protein